MKKKFVTNLAFLIGVNLLIKPFWIFGIDRTVQNSVGAVDYGIYYALFNFPFYLTFCLMQELPILTTEIFLKTNTC